MQIAERQTDQGGSEQAKAVQTDQVAIDADDQRRHRQQQQKLDQVPLRRRQLEQRHALEETFQSRHLFRLGLPAR